MKLTNVIIGSVLLISSVTYAQEPIYEWGQEQKKEVEGSSTFKIIGTDENVTCGIVTSPPDEFNGVHYLICYDNTFKKKFSVRLFKNLTDAKDASTKGYNNAFFVKGKVLLIADGFRTQAKSAYCGVSEVDMSNGDLSDLRELDNLDGGKIFNHGVFTPKISEDQSKMLIYTEKPGDKDEPQAIRIKVFNTNDWKELASADIELPYSKKKNQHREVIIDNNGGVYVYVQYKVEKGIYEEHLFTYGIDNKKWEDHNLNVNGNLISTVKFKFDVAQNLIVSGLLTKEKEYRYSSAFYFLVDQQTKKITKEKILPFGDEVLQKWTNAVSEVSFKKLEGLSHYFVLKEVFPRSDGSVIQVLEYKEESHVSRAPTSGGMGVATDYTYNTNDILVICIGAEGNLAWMKTIKKQQIFLSREVDDNKFGSFLYGFEKDRPVILYNNQKINEYFTDLKTLKTGYVKWKGSDQKEYAKDNFAPKTVLGTFLYAIEANGDLKYTNDYGLPLFHLHDKAIFETSLCSDSFVQYNGFLYVWAEMPTGSRYKVGRIKLFN